MSIMLNKSLYWKHANVVDAWQFTPETCTLPIWDRTNIDPELWEVTISENKDIFMHVGDWYITETIGKTNIEYVLSSEDFNKYMEPYDEEEHRADSINQEDLLFFNL